MAEHSPFLHQAIMEVVENQIRDNDPPETGATFVRLLGEGHSEKEAKRLIATAIVGEIYGMLKRGEEFDRARFAAALDKLPELPLGEE